MTKDEVMGAFNQVWQKHTNTAYAHPGVNAVLDIMRTEFIDALEKLEPKPAAQANKPKEEAKEH